MEQFDLIIKAGRAITPEGERALSIGIQGGRITAINDFNPTATASHVITLGDDEVLMPGLVDSHVHICEPGNTGLGRVSDGYTCGRRRRNYHAR